MISLSKRLQVIADYIDKGDSVADIGTDHGYIPIYLFQNNISDRIIMTDVNCGPIKTANKNATKYLGMHSIEMRVGDGLAVIGEKEVDVVVIAGMGGLLIRDILQADIKKALSFKKLILQPRNAQDKLRKWLACNGFYIEDETLAREGKFICEIMKVVRGCENVSDEIFYEIGQRLVEKNDPLLMEFIDRKISVEEKIIFCTRDAKSADAIQRHDMSLKRIQKLEEVKKRCRQI